MSVARGLPAGAAQLGPGRFLFHESARSDKVAVSNVAIRGAQLEKIALQALRADAQYRGTFSAHPFHLLANPSPLYRSLLGHLSNYGARLDTLRFDATSIGEANISCNLLDLNTSVQLRLDRLEVTFLRFLEVGKVAPLIVADSWAAVHQVDSELKLQTHFVSLNVQAKIVGARYDSVVRRYITTPAGFGSDASAGVAFYLPANREAGQVLGNITLDRLAGSEENLVVRLGVGFDASAVRIEEIETRTEKYLSGLLQELGLTFEKQQGG